MKESAALTARRFRAGRPLPRYFYHRDTEHVARDLLGCVLECTTPDGTTAGIIVETEAYLGEHDPACHAASGLTARTRPLYDAPGTSYVYFIYGMYWCVNAVTRDEGLPSAVLIRALQPTTGLELMRSRRPKARKDLELCSGPGKLCQALGITGAHNRSPLQRRPLRILEGIKIPDRVVGVTPRIGIKKAADWPLRWVVQAPLAVGR